MEHLVQFLPSSVDKVSIHDRFWDKYIETICKHSVSYLWNAMNDNVRGAEKSHALENYRIAAGISEGRHYGAVFQDSDVTKWIEGAAISLNHRPDRELERTIDDIVDIIAAAQENDGYLNTYFSINRPNDKWTNLLEGHELYCAGHLIEAAVAYFCATGKGKLLDVARRFADLICAKFGTGAEQIEGYPGHPEIELALVKLYDLTRDEKYLRQAEFFILRRGKTPEYFDAEKKHRNGVFIHPEMQFYGPEFSQAHAHVLQQSESTGHAVRAMYLYCGMADVAMRTGNKNLINTLKEIWHDCVNRKIYITGGIGASAFGESFSSAYDLPNDRAYAETCAGVGLMMFANRMLQMELNSEYADIIELVLYNLVIAGMQLDGKAFFYVNPLEVYPELCERQDTKHVLPVRQKWFSCSCCPSNAIRTVLSIGSYAYSISEDTINIHQYIGCDLTASVNNHTVTLRSLCEYPECGKIKYVVEVDLPVSMKFNFRIPGWSNGFCLRINGSEVKSYESEHGYLKIDRTFENGDTIEIDFNMEIQIIRTNSAVRYNSGKAAVKRGPIVYCIESADNDPDLHLLRLDTENELIARYHADLLGGTIAIHARGTRLIQPDNVGQTLYFSNRKFKQKDVEIMMIPYYKWSNRGSGEMRVWIEEK